MARTKYIFVIVVVIILLGLAWILSHRTSEPDSSTLSLSPAPDFTWHAFDGSTHTLKELSGHVVVIHFWASWCEPCREELPKLLNAAAKLNGKVIFLTLSSDEDATKAQLFIRAAQATSKIKAPPNVLYGFDPKKQITFDIFQTVQYPESIVIDSEQRLRRKFSGAVDWDSKDIEEYLRQLP